MNALLSNLMAQMESWEAANEFGIPELSWVDYDARKRSDDLYICCIASIFDALRIADDKVRRSELDALAKTLVIKTIHNNPIHLSICLSLKMLMNRPQMFY